MEQLFSIRPTKNHSCPLVVFSVCYISPVEQLDLVARSLATMGFRGTVIFDLLLSNGNEFNRFVSLDFDGEKFRLDSFKIINPTTSILNISNSFYESSPELFENSVLSYNSFKKTG